MVTKVHSGTTKQIHLAWQELSQAYWRREQQQLTSAIKLLEEYPDEIDIFGLTGIPEGVDIWRRE
jgi:hypothetical protein